MSLDPTVFADYLTRTRWFGGKGRPFTVGGVRSIGGLPGGSEGGPVVRIHLVEVRYADGLAGEELYQVPLVYYTNPEYRLDHAFVGWWEDDDLGWVHAYDALHDKDAMALWLEAFNKAAATDGALLTNVVDPDSGLAFHRLPGHDLDISSHSSLYSGEQSNSSVYYGEDAVMKVFRKVTPGVNPDVQIHEVLTTVGVDNVAPLYGWLDAVVPDVSGTDGEDRAGEMIQLAMLQKFLRTATDGWELAQASVRTLFAEPELHAAESGGDFAGEAGRLGEALAHIHLALAEHFPTYSLGSEAAADLAATMRRRLEEAVQVVPALTPYAAALGELFAGVADLRSLQVQTIHGDLHLGQTLRTSVGWKIVDFEGEPAKPLAERLLPDSPWRDIAGMLRSFDYAPRSYIHNLQAGEDDQLDTRAAEWANRCRNHFLVSYAGGELDAQQQTLLAAYIADKAVYECVYEALNRPTWLDIPLDAIARLTTT